MTGDSNFHFLPPKFEIVSLEKIDPVKLSELETEIKVHSDIQLIAYIDYQ